MGPLAARRDTGTMRSNETSFFQTGKSPRHGGETGLVPVSSDGIHNFARAGQVSDTIPLGLAYRGEIGENVPLQSRQPVINVLLWSVDNLIGPEGDGDGVAALHGARSDHRSRRGALGLPFPLGAQL